MTLKEKYDANVEFVNKLRFYCKNHNCKQSVPFGASKCDLSECECCTIEKMTYGKNGIFRITARSQVEYTLFGRMKHRIPVNMTDLILGLTQS